MAHGFGAALIATVLVCAAGPEAQSPARSGGADDSRPTLHALRVAEPPAIDGRLDEEAWAQAPLADHFRQRDPDEGQPATERTEIRVLYDDQALYIGARLFDSDPSAISRRLSGRDDGPDADHLAVLLDPRDDHTSGARFVVSAAASSSRLTSLPARSSSSARRAIRSMTARAPSARSAWT